MRCQSTARYVTIILIVVIILVYKHFRKQVFYSSAVSNRLIKDSPPQNLKFILQWTLPDTIPFVEMKSGQTTFIERGCHFTNCFVTSNRTLLKSLRDYDVIAFHGPELTRMKEHVKLPPERDPRQKYIYVSIESSHNYPLCNRVFDNFFNWTWTYRLDSDVPYAYVTVKDIKNNVLGPSKYVKWLNQTNMIPVSVAFKDLLKSKRKAAAWMVSNCNALSKREGYVKNLQKELEKYGLTVDVYGACGDLKCPVGKAKCFQMIEQDYYFYLAFENSFSEYYVTEKLLHALQHRAVPIVLGAANYSRFMPPGAYLNAIELGETKLATRMHELISNPDVYHNMFRWRNHYSYHSPYESVETDPLCRLCEMINDGKLMGETTVYENFRDWWNTHLKTC